MQVDSARGMRRKSAGRRAKQGQVRRAEHQPRPIVARPSAAPCLPGRCRLARPTGNSPKARIDLISEPARIRRVRVPQKLHRVARRKLPKLPAALLRSLKGRGRDLFIVATAKHGREVPLTRPNFGYIVVDDFVDLHDIDTYKMRPLLLQSRGLRFGPRPSSKQRSANARAIDRKDGVGIHIDRKTPFIWRALVNWKPRVVAIEYEPSQEWIVRL
jgi:hypothetical protein